MKRAAAFLVLLLCLYWTRAQGESGGLTENDVIQTEVQSEILGVKTTIDQTNFTPDIWDELKALRDMVIQHSLELRNSKSKIEKLERENTAIQDRLTASEIKNAVLEARMNTTESLVKELQRENTDLEVRVNTAEIVVEELKRQNAVLESRMSSTELQVEELKGENAEQKVAFTVGLTDEGGVGPFSTDTTLKFSKIFTNIGQAYDPSTGLFTAPVRGTYYIRFNGLEVRTHSRIIIDLYHNNKRIATGVDENDDIGYVAVSNGFVLQLEKGDVIYMLLRSGYGVWDDRDNVTTLSGFLLFAM